eukprot:6173493-Pleurochrysis_carterae.AAC.3
MELLRHASVASIASVASGTTEHGNHTTTALGHSSVDPSLRPLSRNASGSRISAAVPPSPHSAARARLLLPSSSTRSSLRARRAATHDSDSEDLLLSCFNLQAFSQALAAIALSPAECDASTFALDQSSPLWQEHASGPRCELCETEFGAQHKHVSRRHCRQCGRIYCYLCTYDKASLPLQSRHSGCVPCLPRPTKMVDVHVCTKCYDGLPMPMDGLRRCRYCGQKVTRLPLPRNDWLLPTRLATPLRVSSIVR